MTQPERAQRVGPAPAQPLAAVKAAIGAALRRWRIAAVVLVLAAAAAGLVWSRRARGQTEDLSQLVSVTRGNLVANVSPTGEVYAPRTAQLSFDVTRIPLIELNVVPGQRVKAGDVLARIDPSALERAVAQAEADLTVAKDNLEKAQAPYTELDLTQARLVVTQALLALTDALEQREAVLKPDLEAQRTVVKDAYAALTNAKNQLVAVENSAENAARLRTLEYEAIWYRNNYWEAQEKFKNGKIDQQKLDWEYSNMLAAEERLRQARASAESSLSSAQSQVAKAEKAYQDAMADLTALEKGPDATKLTRAEIAVTQAEIALAKAENALAEIEAGPNPKDIEVAQARVLSAQATLAEAQAALEAATMTAPFDATVISVGAAVGDLVSSNTTIVTLADLSNLRVRAIVDETEISQVEIGQEAVITFDAFPGYRFRGQVLEVPLQGQITQNILTYEVPVSLEGTEEVSLKPGMTANVSIVVGRRQNVLLVPVMAVQQGEEGSVVRVQDSPQGPAVEAPVSLGLSDGMYVEVRRGLNEGDRVVIAYQAAQESPAVFRGAGSIAAPIPGGQRVIVRP